MDKSGSSQSGQTAATSTSKRIKNTFSRSKNEYFTPATLFSLCKYGFPFEKLPEEAKEMVLEYSKYHASRCTHSDGEIKIASLDVPPEDQLR
ncbi:MAG: hypothetical protein MPI95_03945 [Nitrosopumilus sp.]|nr:hypothetical protein [Nitrosopumilus sp.]CAI9832376.1 conserved hypothetical protein [Nitrosopumilaceae archaeon]MDA7941729.1 hypothetical protein [Nitrosopumilus sp.]MDA7945432.1 hypothetical protein [Nitrosopumilus sp.]MDA7953390.1 hypothetical protein [Nitrosopumilus sp.]